MSEIINWLRRPYKYVVFGGVKANGITYIKFFETKEDGEQGVFNYFSMLEKNHRMGIKRIGFEPSGWPESLDLNADMTLEQIVNQDYFACMADEDEFYDTDFLWDDCGERRKQFKLMGFIYHDVSRTENPKATVVDNWTWKGDDYEWAALVSLI